MTQLIAGGRIEMNDAETKALEKLRSENPGNLSITRRDPGESGPLLAHIDDETWEISEDGKRKKVS